MVRGEIITALSGASFIGNSVLRVMADAKAALAHLVLRYIDWLSKQLLPDTAETEWLDRHGDIWLVNADGSTGRKAATYASGVITMTGTSGIVVPQGTQVASAISGITYETTEAVTLGLVPVEVDVRAIDAGAAGNLNAGDSLAFVATQASVDATATVVSMGGGADEEIDDDLRTRVLERIRQPPMGGAVHDYVGWAKDVAGVTRAWAAQEMGIGTVTVRFMMDDLRAENDGFPLPADVRAVEEYIDSVRPVAVKDFFVVAPVRQRVDFLVTALDPDTPATRTAVVESCREMLEERAAPGQTIFGAWKSEAVLAAAGVVSFQINCDDDIMQSPGHMGVLGDVYFVGGMQQ